MIVKQPVLKKMMKAAWKSSFGLTVARVGEWLWMEAEGWEIWMLFEMIPNQIKGDIVTLVGEFPAEGEGFTAYKDQGNQTILESAIASPAVREIDWKNIYGSTFFILKDSQATLKMYQNSRKEIKVISSAADDLICPRLLDKDAGEIPPEGPAEINNGLAWKNNFFQMIFYEPGIKNEMAITGLEALARVNIRY